MRSKKDSCKARYRNEAVLIAGVRTGDNQAVTCLYRMLFKKSFPSVRKLVLSQGGAIADAEDLFQEAFIAFRRKVLDGSYEYRANTAISTYFYDIFRYKWRDELASSRRKRADASDISHISSADKNADDRLITSERDQQIRQLIQQLGENCATILKFFIWHKWSMESIAEELGITPKSAKNQKYRCMQKLRELALGNGSRF